MSHLSETDGSLECSSTKDSNKDGHLEKPTESVAPSSNETPDSRLGSTKDSQDNPTQASGDNSGSHDDTKQETNNPSDMIDSNRTTDPTKPNPSSSQIALQTCITSLEQQLQKSKRDLECMVLKYAKSERENLLNKQKSEDLDKKLKRAIKDNDQLANRIKLLNNDKNQLTDTLNAKVAQLTVLEQKNNHLNNVQGVKLKEYEEKIKKLEITNEEYSTLIDSYKSKEGELLDFSERLSMKHMMLQSELDKALKNVPNYKDEYDNSRKKVNELLEERDMLIKRVEGLELQLKDVQEKNEKLKSEKESERSVYRAEIDKLENEVKVMRRKHQIANKELLKEIKLLKSQAEMASGKFEAKNGKSILVNSKDEVTTKSTTLVT